jgi:hypothetical protein
MKRNDLLTGEVFYPSRITQKFARADNRIKYHNLKANKLRHSVMYVNSPLHKNLRILNEIMEGKDKGIFHKQFLLGKGYSLGVMTHYKQVEGKQISCVYHYGITSDVNDKLVIIRINQSTND